MPNAESNTNWETLSPASNSQTLSIPSPKVIARTVQLIARNLCALWGSHDDEHRWFVRSLVPFEVHGRLETCSWGIWVEVTRPAFDEIVRLWDEPNQLVHGPWRGTIANDAATYASTTGLRGTLRFVDVTSIPHFAPDPELEHPFVQEWRTGVSIKRMTDWQLAFSHSA